MSIFIDSGLIIGYYHVKDKYHHKAVEIYTEINKEYFGTIYMSDFVFSECVNYIINRADYGLAAKLGDGVLESNVVLLQVEKDVFSSAWNLFKQRKNLGFTDCTIVETMRRHKIKNLATFDNGFKQFKKEFNILGLE